jgi:8-oxo-dGTP diphosphatase
MQIRKEVQAVLYNRFGKDTRVLLVKKLDRGSFSPRWRLLKGGIEEGETEVEALKREIMEEVGLRDILVEKKIYDYEFDADGVLHQVSSYAVKVMENAPLKVQQDELLDAMWIPKNQVSSLLFWPDERKCVEKLPVKD